MKRQDKWYALSLEVESETEEALADGTGKACSMCSAHDPAMSATLFKCPPVSMQVGRDQNTGGLHTSRMGPKYWSPYKQDGIKILVFILVGWD